MMNRKQKNQSSYISFGNPLGLQLFKEWNYLGTVHVPVPLTLDYA